MDRYGTYGQQDDNDVYDLTQDAAVEAPPVIGTDERRMHVRAYNYWASLLNGRTYPSIEDLDPENLSDFGPHSVLLDFSTGGDNPAIAYLGGKLREECNLSSDVRTVDDVPSRSLISRLTDHYLQIIANCAPIGFEAEFVGALMIEFRQIVELRAALGALDAGRVVQVEHRIRPRPQPDALVRGR